MTRGRPPTLRLRSNEVAAIVSGRYAPLDPIELMETIRSALDRFGILRDVRVRGVASGLIDNLRLVLPNVQNFDDVETADGALRRALLERAPVFVGIAMDAREVRFVLKHLGDVVHEPAWFIIGRRQHGDDGRRADGHAVLGW